MYHVIYPRQPDCLRELYELPKKNLPIVCHKQNVKPASPFINWARYLTDPVGADKSINLGEWTNAERECFKRFFLIYGYGRWQIMREAAKNAGYNLDDKTDEDMALYATGFMQALVSQLHGSETKEIKQFL
jgi:hypothetical protein